MGRTKPCLEEQRKPLSLSLSLFFLSSRASIASLARIAQAENRSLGKLTFSVGHLCVHKRKRNMVCAHAAEGSREGRGTRGSSAKGARRRRRRARFRRAEKLESSPLRGAATWAEEVEKSPRFFTLWKEKGIGEGRRKRWRGGEVVWDSPPRGGRARAFETRFSSPIHLFLSSTPIEKRCSRARLSEEWIPSMKRFLLRDEEKKFHFLIHALCNRAVWKSDGGVGGSILSPRLLRVLFSRIFVEISREEKSKYIIEIGGI